MLFHNVKQDIDNLKNKMSSSFRKDELESIESTAKKAALHLNTEKIL